MRFIDFLKMYLAVSFKNKAKGWRSESLFMVNFDLILQLSAVVSPVSILLFWALGSAFLGFMVSPFLAWIIIWYLDSRFLIFDNIKNLNTDGHGLIELWVFIISFSCLMLSCYLIAAIYDKL